MPPHSLFSLHLSSLPPIASVISSQFSTDFGSGEIGDEIRSSIWSADYSATASPGSERSAGKYFEPFSQQRHGEASGDQQDGAGHDSFKKYPLMSAVSFCPFPSVLADGQRGADKGESVFGGFLPEIGRVWVSVGSALYLWSTEGAPTSSAYPDASSGGDFALFDALEESIVSVGVAPVVPGVFVPTVSHVLCVATIDAVHILGVSLSGGLVTGELSLHPTGLVAPCDGAVVLSLAATATGRIFAGCRDGRLYELVYTEPITPSFSSWLFGSTPVASASASAVGAKAARRGGGLSAGVQAPRAVRPSKCRKVDHSSSPLDYVLPAFLRKLVVSHDPIVQVLVDDHRSILYALSDKGAISLYDLGLACTSFAHVATVARPLRDAATVCPRLHSVGAGAANGSGSSAAGSSASPARVVSVSLVSPEDSATVACVATASNGARLYYVVAASPSTRPIYSTSVGTVPARGERQAPTRLHLQHVRLPPEGVGGVGSSLPVRSAAVSAGLAVVCVDGGADGGDDHLVFCVDEAPLRGEGDEQALGAASTGMPYGTAVSRRTRPSLRERVQSFTVGGYAFAAIERPRAPVADPWLPSGAAPPTLPLSSAATGVPSLSPAFGLDRDLALGYAEAPREVLALSGTGLYRFVRARPTDVLMAALEASRGDARGAEVCAVVQQLGSVEVCAQLLLLASSRAPDSSDARAVDHVAGEPAPAPLLPAAPLSTDMADMATHAFFTLAGSPCLEGDEDDAARAGAATGGGLGSRASLFGAGYRAGALGGGGEDGGIPPALAPLIPSVGHAALLLHVARLVRPLWSFPIARAIPGSHGVLELRVSVASLRRQERALRALLRWLMAHPQFTSLPPSDKALSFAAVPSPDDTTATNAPTHLGGRGYEAPGERRRRAERALTLEREALSATLLTVIRASEAMSLLILLGEASFGNLVAAGGERLREAVETLTFADMVSTKRGAETASLLINELVVAYAAERLDIATVCGALESQCESFYAATDRARFSGHELLHRAATVASYDSRQAEDLAAEAASHFVKSAGSLDWPTIAARFRRLGAHEALLRVALARGAAQDKNNLAVQVHRGVPELDDRARELHRLRVDTYREVLTALSELHDARRTDELARLRHRIFESRDELLHLLVYEWHLAQGDSGEVEDALLDARPRFLEDFLRRESLDTLTKYYVRGGEAEPAARELMLAARSRTRELSLNERVERLSRAKGCLAHVTGSGASRPHSQAQSAAALYQDVSAELEVAMVQLATQSVLRELGSKSSTGTVRSSALAAAADLDKGLLGLSELFNQYAHPFDLFEVQLVIIEVARHEDARRVNIIWKKLIGQALADGGSRAVARRVEELGRRFYPNELVFPVPFIAERLERVAERVAAGGGGSTGWVVDALAEAGVPYSRLFEVYEELAHTLTDLSPASTVTLLTHQCTIIERWADELHVGRQRPRSVFTGQRVDEAIDHYCVILSGTPSPAAKSLIVSLRAVRDAVFAENV